MQCKEVLQLLRNLGVYLLPRDVNDITSFDCDCPEYRNRGRGNPYYHNPEPYMQARHGVVFYWLAHGIDEDPLMVFKMRSFAMPSVPSPQLTLTVLGGSTLQPIVL